MSSILGSGYRFFTPVLAIKQAALASLTGLIYTELVLQVQHRGPSLFEIQLVGLVKVLASLQERHPKNPAQLARLQVTSPWTCLQSSFPLFNSSYSLLTLDAQAYNGKPQAAVDLQGNDLLTGNRRSDLYTISLQETTSSTPICFMVKASPTQAWLWHQRLSHLNFDYINLLSKKDIVIGLPTLKYVKD
ncbi:retrovirus-related pol polyprotein from transposon TNT 1-94 [Tanacetum coccineum]